MSVWTYVSEGKKGGKGGTGRSGVYHAGERYPITYWNLQTRWRRALAKAGVEDFRFHDLRHTAASRLLRKTHDLKMVQDMLDHAQITTTTKYAHVLKDDLRAGMEAAQEAARQAANRPGVDAVIRQLEPASVPQHVRMDLEAAQLREFAHLADHL
jgi:site-specific recombinase XerD